MITFTPLSESSYLLCVDSARVLLDCGTYDRSPEFPSSSTSTLSSAASIEYLRRLAELAPTLSLVVLTHPLLSSVGLLPWLKTKCGLRCPVYATLPTREMGRWAVEEWVEARSMEEKNTARDVVNTEESTGGASNKKRSKGKGKEVLLAEPKVEEGDDDKMDIVREEEGDPWKAVWQLTKKEIRETFVSVNAVRWTQPIHLSGASHSCPIH